MNAPEGFYVSVQRGRRYGLLLGPYPSRAEAEKHVTAGRDLAAKVDSFTCFDAFGTTRIAMQPGAALPAGKLNAMHAAMV